MKALLVTTWVFICNKIFAPFTWCWLIGLFHHGKYWRLTDKDWAKLEELLRAENFVILTRRRTHLTTYLISLGCKIRTGKWGFWGHAVMNLEGEPGGHGDFRLVQAVGTGTSWSTFQQVFDCDAVCVLRPKGVLPGDWDKVLARAEIDVGKPYDDLFQYQQDQNLSCVELVRDCLSQASGYKDNFSAFEKLVEKYHAVTPDMFYHCEDFEVVFEVRR